MQPQASRRQHRSATAQVRPRKPHRPLRPADDPRIHQHHCCVQREQQNVRQQQNTSVHHLSPVRERRRVLDVTPQHDQFISGCPHRMRRPPQKRTRYSTSNRGHHAPSPRKTNSPIKSKTCKHLYQTYVPQLLTAHQRNAPSFWIPVTLWSYKSIPFSFFRTNPTTSSVTYIGGRIASTGVPCTSFNETPFHSGLPSTPSGTSTASARSRYSRAESLKSATSGSSTLR